MSSRGFGEREDAARRAAASRFRSGARKASAGLLFALAVLPGAAAGSGAPSGDAPERTSRPDRWREGVGREFNDWADFLDRSLAPGAAAGERASAEVRASLVANLSDLRGRFSARLTLPRAARQFQLLLDDRRPDGDPGPFDDPLRPGPLDPVIRRIPLLRPFRTTYGLRTSLSLRPTFGPYIKGYRRAGSWLTIPSALLYWSGADGFGARARFDLERASAGDARLQLAPQATWSEGTEGVELRQGAALSRPLGRNGRIGAEIEATASTRPSTTLDNAQGALRYRLRAGRDWLFLEVSPRMDFPREKGYRGRSGLQLRAEVWFS